MDGFGSRARNRVPNSDERGAERRRWRLSSKQKFTRAWTTAFIEETKPDGLYLSNVIKEGVTGLGDGFEHWEYKRVKSQK